QSRAVGRLIASAGMKKRQRVGRRPRAQTRASRLGFALRAQAASGLRFARLAHSLIRSAVRPADTTRRDKVESTAPASVPTRDARTPESTRAAPAILARWC